MKTRDVESDILGAIGDINVLTRAAWKLFVERRPARPLTEQQQQQYELVLGQVLHVQAELRGLQLLIEQSKR